MLENICQTVQYNYKKKCNGFIKDTVENHILIIGRQGNNLLESFL